MPRRNEIDLDKLLSPKEGRRFTDREFIFSDSLTAKSELLEELEELDSVKDEKKGQKLIQTVTTVGGAVGLVYGTVKGLSGIERWMKQMEIRDIEEERQLTGQYISIDAGDVDTSIDPTTGKNLTISKPTRSSANVSTSGGAAEEEERKAPWLLRVLGLDKAVSADDDDFWAAPEATVSKPKAPGGGGGGADSRGGSPGEDGGGGEPGGGDDDLDDDSSGMDALDDLLG